MSGERLITLAHMMLLWDMEGENSCSMPTLPQAMVEKCLGLDTDLCKEQLFCRMPTMRWKPACWQWWQWEAAASERSTEVHASCSETMALLGLGGLLQPGCVASARPWEQKEPLSVSWSPNPALFISNPKLLMSFCSALNFSFRVLSKIFQFPNSPSCLWLQTFISSFVKGTEIQLMWPNGCWMVLSVPLS